MKDIHVTFGKKGRTTIPQPLRRKLGWQAGDIISFRLKGNAVVITRLHAREKTMPAPPKKPRPRLFVMLIGGDGNG